MRRIVHVSDLHFGNNDPALFTPLREAIENIRPDLTVISGDLVEHASTEEFREAHDFLKTLPHPQIVVPGNHDLPFYNLWERGLVGLSRYRNCISRDMQPRFDDREMTVIGANTSRLWPIRGGSLSSMQLESLAKDFAAVPESHMRILVTHHPFDLPPKQSRHLIVGHAKRSIQRLAPIVDILMAGHIHLSSTGSTATRYKTSGHAIAFVQAGTAVSRRDKGENNSFNSLLVSGPEDGVKRATVDTWSWNRERFEFARLCSNDFRLKSEGWTRLKAAEPPQPATGEIVEEPGVTRQ